MTDILKAGVAGAGVFGGYHANKYTEVDGARLEAIYDPDGARAHDAADARGVDAYDDYGAFLESIDLLTIAAPASVHADLARRALGAGKPVLVEKPLALDPDEARALEELAEAKGLVLQVGHQERYVADAFGLLGRPRPQKLRSRRLNRFSGRAMDVSVVHDLMIHDLDLLAQYTVIEGAEITSIEARTEKGEKPDFVAVDLRFPSGLAARLEASRLEEEPLRDLTLTYEAGHVRLDFLGRATENTTATPLPVDFASDDKPAALVDPLRYGTQAFVDAVRNGKPPIVSAADGRAAVVLAAMIEKAAIDAAGE